ncbi:MAG TPA: 16S rRNA (uracil(1498)-N(3))-methyltransferase [Firmicutes bacterium]|nr:16S rRNA (uracil(1498)-N(3))-methyltransferase [Bacillota bacterium]
MEIVGGDAVHILKSLRMSVGDRLTICDGSGSDAECEIYEAGRDYLKLKVLSRSLSLSEPNIEVNLYQCLPKGDKFDGVVRKSVELGVHSVTPVISSRVISRPDQKALAKKAERWNKISREAAGQSGRGIVPMVREALSFDLAVKEASLSDKDECILNIFFYECGGKPMSELNLAGIKTINIFIGPEGGYSPAEAKTAENAGFFTATLGSRILRTETAPVAALSVIMYITGNMG